MFDQNESAGGSALDSVIEGWRAALRAMPVGACWRVVISSAQAYGHKALATTVRPTAPLVFEIDLPGSAKITKTALSRMETRRFVRLAGESDRYCRTLCAALAVGVQDFDEAVLQLRKRSCKTVAADLQLRDEASSFTAIAVVGSLIVEVSRIRCDGFQPGKICPASSRPRLDREGLPSAVSCS